MEKTLFVSLGKRSYSIHIGTDNLKTIGEKLKQYNLKERATIISTPHIFKLYGSAVVKSLKDQGIDSQTVQVEHGEESKSLEKASQIYDKLIGSKTDRFMPILALGGGMIGDLSGFVASTYMRGTPYIQLPTTLLAQVDSSIGGKVAVNHPEAKNIIGSFYQPRFVLADMNTLKSLPERKYLSGLAEVVKYAFISADDFLDYLEENISGIMAKETDVLTEIVLRCCRIKGKIVEEDERDYGLRAVLNFGHTIGHSIEAVSHYENYRHGEAVAIGIMGAALVSKIKGYADDKLVSKVRNLLTSLSLPTELKEVSVKEILEHIKLDKKVVEGKIQFVLLKAPGEVIIESVDSKTIEKAVEQLVKEGAHA